MYDSQSLSNILLAHNMHPNETHGREFAENEFMQVSE